jgi:hypothetical protein
MLGSIGNVRIEGMLGTIGRHGAGSPGAPWR